MRLANCPLHLLHLRHPLLHLVKRQRHPPGLPVSRVLRQSTSSSAAPPSNTLLRQLSKKAKVPYSHDPSRRIRRAPLEVVDRGEKAGEPSLRHVKERNARNSRFEVASTNCNALTSSTTVDSSSNVTQPSAAAGVTSSPLPRTPLSTNRLSTPSRRAEREWRAKIVALSAKHGYGRVPRSPGSPASMKPRRTGGPVPPRRTPRHVPTPTPTASIAPVESQTRLAREIEMRTPMPIRSGKTTVSGGTTARDTPVSASKVSEAGSPADDTLLTPREDSLLTTKTTIIMPFKFHPYLNLSSFDPEISPHSETEETGMPEGRRKEAKSCISARSFATLGYHPLASEASAPSPTPVANGTVGSPVAAGSPSPKKHRPGLPLQLQSTGEASDATYQPHDPASLAPANALGPRSPTKLSFPPAQHHSPTTVHILQAEMHLLSLSLINDREMTMDESPCKVHPFSLQSDLSPSSGLMDPVTPTRTKQPLDAGKTEIGTTGENGDDDYNLPPTPVGKSPRHLLRGPCMIEGLKENKNNTRLTAKPNAEQSESSARLTPKRTSHSTPRYEAEEQPARDQAYGLVLGTEDANATRPFTKLPSTTSSTSHTTAPPPPVKVAKTQRSHARPGKHPHPRSAKVARPNGARAEIIGSGSTFAPAMSQRDLTPGMNTGDRPPKSGLPLAVGVLWIWSIAELCSICTPRGRLCCSSAGSGQGS